MITVQVTSVKAFMQQLLLSGSFDDWKFHGTTIQSLTDYEISGVLNPRYLTDHEKEQRAGEDFVRYGDVRPLVASVIKSGRTPTLIKMVLACPEKLLGGHESVAASSYLCTLQFQDGVLRLTGGIALETFTLDRSDAVFWDERLPQILKSLNIEFTES